MKNSELSSELLRHRAEELLKIRLSESNLQLSESDALKRVHELEVTQIELELQNEELELAKMQDEKTRRLIHNLEVQQIELELQNEELSLARQVSEESTQKYAELYDFAPTAYFSISSEGEIIELNLTAAKLLGRDRTSLLNRRFAYFINDESKTIFNHFLDKVFDGSQKVTCELTLSIKDTAPIHVHLTARISAKADSCLLNAIDITDRKQAEEELKDTKLLLQSSIESQKEMIIISIDKQYNYLYFNQFHKSIMADLYGNEVRIGMNVLENITTDEDRDNFKANCDRALAGESHISINEYGDLKRDYYEARYNPIVNDRNEIIGATIFSENISKRILADTKLLESELFVKNIINSLTAQVVVLDEQGVILAVNNAWKKFAVKNESPNHIDYLGFNYLQVCDTSSKRGDATAQIVAEGIRAVLDGSLTEYNSEYPCHAPLKERWFTLSVLPLNNSQRGVVVIHQDITERKLAEEALLNNEVLLKKALLASTKLIASNSDTIDYEKINEMILDISGAIASIYNVYDANSSVFTTKSVVGFKDIHKKASSMLGFELRNKKWKLNPAIEEKIKNSSFKQFDSFHELFEDYIPKPISLAFEKAYNIGEVSVVRISINNKTVGDFTLIFPKGKKHNNRELIELYAIQVGQFVKRYQSEITLRDSEEALNKVLLASAEFIGSSSNTIDYEKMTDILLKMTGARCVVYNAFENNGLEYTTAAISGFNGIRKITSTVLGYDMINKKWKYDPALAAKIKNNIITQFKTFQELSVAFIPKPVAKLIELTVNFGEVAIVKVKVNEKLVGNFTLFFSKGETLQNPKIVELYANQVGLFINRKQTEDALTKSEQMLQNILEHFPGDVFWKDTQSTFLGCNKSFAATVGLKSQTDILWKNDFDFQYPTNEAENFRADDVEVMNTGIAKLHIEEMRRQPDGSVVWSDTNKIPLRDSGGKTIGVLGVITDITERRLAQESLKESEQMLQYVLDNFPGLVYWKDTQSRYLGCNHLFALGAGFSNSSEIINKTDYDLPWIKNDADDYIANDNEVINSAKEILHKLETQQQANNKVSWFDTSKIPLFNSDAKVIGVLGVSIDITERKQAEDDLQKLNELLEERVKERTIELVKSNVSLQKAEEKFRTVADFTHGWEYWIDNDGKILYMSPSAFTVTGYSAAEFMNHHELLNNIIYPADKELWENHKKTWQNKGLNKKHNELNFRILTKEGEVRWIGHVSRYVLINGEFQGIRVSNRNITERIKAENELMKVTIEVEERERNRFSSELHDSMGPLLSTIKLYFQWLSETDDAEKLKFIVEKGNHNIEVAIQTSREISRGLSSLYLNKIGYVGALSDFAQGINDTKKLEIDFSYNRNDRFNVFLETTLFRITTELIKNTLSYANATQAAIGFYYSIERQIIFFTYTDNGIGFNIEDIDKAGKGMGLLSIQQRIKSVRGKIRFKSKNGNGMKVTIILRVNNGSY